MLVCSQLGKKWGREGKKARVTERTDGLFIYAIHCLYVIGGSLGCPKKDSSWSQERIQEGDRCRKAKMMCWKQKYTFEKKMWANSENWVALRKSRSKGFLFLPRGKLGMSRWSGLFFSCLWAGPSVFCFFFHIWFLWNCHGVRYMMGIVVIAMQVTL